MDLPKLPKFSQTPPPPPSSPEPPPSGPGQVPPTQPLASLWAEAWISIAIGAIVLLMQQRLLGYLFGQDTAPIIDGPNTIPYAQSLFFFHDLGLALFGVALILDGVVFLIARPWAVRIGLGLTLIASLLNLHTLVRTYGPYGLQWLPALAFAIGVYTAIYQWKLLTTIRLHRPAPMT